MIIFRILLLLGIFGGAGWLLFSISSDFSNSTSGTTTEKPQLKPIKINNDKHKKIKKAEVIEEVKDNTSVSQNIKEENNLIKKTEKTKEPIQINIQDQKEDLKEKTETKNKVSKKVLAKEVKKQPIEDGKLLINVYNWRLSGTQSNILVIDIELLNGLDKDIINEPYVFSCSSNKGDNLSKKKFINVISKEKGDISLLMGYVNPYTEDINCIFTKAENSKRVIYNSVNKNVFIKNETIQNEKEKKEEELGIPLPSF